MIGNVIVETLCAGCNRSKGDCGEISNTRYGWLCNGCHVRILEKRVRALEGAVDPLANFALSVSFTPETVIALDGIGGNHIKACHVMDARMALEVGLPISNGWKYTRAAEDEEYFDLKDRVKELEDALKPFVQWVGSAKVFYTGGDVHIPVKIEDYKKACELMKDVKKSTNVDEKSEVPALIEELDRKDKRIKELEDALRPFVEAAENQEVLARNHDVVTMAIRSVYLRRACDTLRNINKSTNNKTKPAPSYLTPRRQASHDCPPQELTVANINGKLYKCIPVDSLAPHPPAICIGLPTIARLLRGQTVELTEVVLIPSSEFMTAAKHADECESKGVNDK